MVERRTKNPIKTLLQSEKYFGYLTILPLLTGMIIFSFIPLVQAFYYSLTKWDGVTAPVLHGLRNYVTVFTNATTRQEMLNTLVFTAGTVPVSMILSLLLANLLNQKMRGRTVYRVIYYLPSVMMPVAVASAWRWMFNARLGVINQVLGALGLAQPQWISNPQYVMPAIIIVTIWSTIGYNMVILLAGLQGIPSELYESAEIDGANPFTRFFRITLPLLSPTLFFLLTVSLISSFKAFDIIYMFTGQVANSPVTMAIRTMVYGIYSHAFESFQMGLASAEAVVLFFIIIIITAIQFALQKRWVIYD